MCRLVINGFINLKFRAYVDGQSETSIVSIAAETGAFIAVRYRTPEGASRSLHSVLAAIFDVRDRRAYRVLYIRLAGLFPVDRIVSNALLFFYCKNIGTGRKQL